MATRLPTDPVMVCVKCKKLITGVYFFEEGHRFRPVHLGCRVMYRPGCKAKRGKPGGNN